MMASEFSRTEWTSSNTFGGVTPCSRAWCIAAAMTGSIGDGVREGDADFGKAAASAFHGLQEFGCVARTGEPAADEGH